PVTPSVYDLMRPDVARIQSLQQTIAAGARRARTLKILAVGGLAAIAAVSAAVAVAGPADMLLVTAIAAVAAIRAARVEFEDDDARDARNRMAAWGPVTPAEAKEVRAAALEDPEVSGWVERWGASPPGLLSWDHTYLMCHIKQRRLVADRE